MSASCWKAQVHYAGCFWLNWSKLPRFNLLKGPIVAAQVILLLAWNLTNAIVHHHNGEAHIYSHTQTHTYIYIYIHLCIDQKTVYQATLYIHVWLFAYTRQSIYVCTCWMYYTKQTHNSFSGQLSTAWNNLTEDGVLVWWKIQKNLTLDRWRLNRVWHVMS